MFRFAIKSSMVSSMIEFVVFFTAIKVLDTLSEFESIRGSVIIFSFIFTPFSRVNQSKIYKRIDFVSISRSSCFKSLS